MTVHRRIPLPTAAARGQLLVAEQILAPTIRSLQASSGPDGPHEGVVLWLGRTVGSTTLALSVVCPPARTGRGYALLDEHAVALAARTARRYGLGVVTQVHSHPGHDTRHSDGDDHLVLMPFPDMFSLVVADYGQGDLHPSRGAGLHQYQDGQWVHVIDDAMTVVPSSPTHANTGRSVLT